MGWPSIMRAPSCRFLSESDGKPRELLPMKFRSACLPAVLLLAAFPALSQVVSVTGGPPYGFDTPQFGKYLKAVCNLVRTPVTCDNPVAPLLDQKITLSQAPSTDPNSKATPVFPLTVGTVFYVLAQSDSGLPVSLSTVGPV